MVYPHLRMVLDRATVRDPDWVLDPPLVPQVYLEALEDFKLYSLMLYSQFETKFT